MSSPYVLTRAKTPRLENADDLFSMLSFLGGQHTSEIRPIFKQGVGIVYNIQGLEVLPEKLRIAEDRGYLTYSESESFPSCPTCNSIQLRLVMACPQCHAGSIAKSDIVIHYGCEYSGPSSEFLNPGQATLSCPKCHKMMKRVGIDYGNPGIGFKCQRCQNVFQFPLVTLVCERAHETKIDGANLMLFPVYKINEKAKSLSGIVEPLVSIQKVLVKAGIHSDVLSHVRGISGNIHIIPLYVTLLLDDKGRRKQIAVDFLLEEASMEQSLLQTFLRVADLKDTEIVLFVKESVKKRLDFIINPNKVSLVTLSSEMPLQETVVREIARIVSKT